jgi:Ser/Thr protein kinase RdoA (MazF antagonist)
MMRSVDELVVMAGRAAEGMLKVATGKEPQEATHSNAATFTAVGEMLNEMAAAARQQQATNKDLLAFMERIANLKVRGASELIERGEWKKIANELQAVAQEALAKRA